MSIGGVWGKILHVNLTDGRNWIEQLPDEVYLRLVGGRALVAYLLLRDLPAGADPLGPDNLLIFAPGILQGTNLPGAGRHGVGAKSPLTGAMASSEAGGWWGHEFKRTGYDALVIHGRRRAGLSVDSRRRGDAAAGRAPVGPRHGRSRRAIHEELGDEKARIAQCGIAGENGVLFASIMHDINRAAGRNGLGAVMGSKQLKAVAVRGTQSAAGRGPGTRAAGGEMAGRKLPRAGGLGGCDGHAGQRGLPQRDRRPAHPQLPGSDLPGCRASAARPCRRRSSASATPARPAPSAASRSWSTRARMRRRS